MIRTLVATIPILFLSLYSAAQAPPIDGSRFAPKLSPTCEVNVVIPDLIQYWEGAFPVYSGEGVDDASLVQVMRLDTDSLGIVDLLVVTDTTKLSDYEWQTYEYKELIKKGNPNEYRSIVCEHRRSKKLIKKIQSALIDKRFLSRRSKSGEFDSKTREALKEFQASVNLHHMPQFDLEVLDMLGVNTDKYREKR